jgi:hypothetical protein
VIAALSWLVLHCAQAPVQHGPEPGPRAGVAGMAGFQSVSKIDFGPSQNRLTAVYVFPDRVRWHFESYGARQRSEHQYFYRAGERVSELASGNASRALTGREHDAVLLQMELRRAAMLWPDGFDWSAGKGDPSTRSASVSADSCCREGALGTLVATLAEGRPARIEARDAEGQLLEALEIRAWQEHGGRTWPRTLALEAGGTGFLETIEAIETRVHFLDLSFLPPDLRPLVPLSPGPTVMARDLVAMTYSVRALPAELGWEEALARARAWIAEAGKELQARGLAVDPIPTFELTPEGRPRACFVRLSTAVVPAPEGFETHGERAGLLLAVRDLAAIDAALVARVLQATPEGSRTGTPYLRVHPSPSPVELVLPLEPAE